ncbi:MAG: dTMP kinase [Chloroflexi bacterium]|nr:dTMP kinase [Chloroflexota bacterium]
MAPSTGDLAGCFVTIEGGEGTGKTTLLAALAERARAKGLDVVTCREPGGTALGERLRSALLGADGSAPDPRAELLVFGAARAQLVAEVIRPALERGWLVLCDRYADSTTAYQHHGRGLPRETVDAVNAAATGALTPDLTLLLDLSPDEGLRRAGRAGDYMEREALAFHERVRDGYGELARSEPQRWRVLDASRGAADVADEAWGEIVRTAQLGPA